LSGSRWDIRIAAVHEAIARLRALVEQQRWAPARRAEHSDLAHPGTNPASRSVGL